MTQSRTTDDRIRAWLDLMPDHAPDRAIDAVLHATSTTPQARPSLAASWRTSRMNRFAQLAVAALVGAALVGGAVLLAGNNPPQPTPSSPPGQSESPGPSTAGGVPGALFGAWMTNVDEIPAIRNGGGPIRLTISNIGTPNLSIDNLQPGARFGSVLEAVAADQLKVTVAEPDSFCLDAGVAATYQWQLSADRSLLTLTALGDPCAPRGATLSRTWVRSLTQSTTIGAGIVDAFQPFFTVVLPDGAYGSRSLTDYVSIERSDHFSMSAWKNPVGFADPCEQVRVAYEPGAAAFVAFFEQHPSFEVLTNEPTTVSGYPAVRLVVRGLDSPCADGSILQFTPVNCDCHWVSGKDVIDSFHVFDVDGDTFVVTVGLASTSEAEAPVIESIRIPASYPSP